MLSSFLAVDRPLYDGTEDDKESVFDLGAGFGWKITEQLSLALNVSKELNGTELYSGSVGLETVF